MTATLTWRAGVEAALARAARAEAVPGLVVAVAHGDGAPEHLVAAPTGPADPLAADSLFPVASVTKLVTALAVLRLADAGRLTIDDPLERHVPEAAAAQPGVTLRRLLTHTSGLSGDYAEALAPRTTALTWALSRTPPLQSAAPSAARPSGSTTATSTTPAGHRHRAGHRPAVPGGAAGAVLAPLGIEGYLGVEPPRPRRTSPGLPSTSSPARGSTVTIPPSRGRCPCRGAAWSPRPPA